LIPAFIIWTPVSARCPLPAGYALYLPAAFDKTSRDLLARSFGDKLISLTQEEGSQFCANAVCAGRVIVMNQATLRLKKLLGGLGFSVLETPLSEFMKSGGSAKCLTLSLEGWASN
jgi:N-dimethylarginine dimethylaminohydrolase